MALVDLLKNPEAYNVSYGGPSKGITYLPNMKDFKGNSGQSGIQRVSWDVTNDNADPTYELGDGIDKTFRNSFGVTDGFIRGGITANIRRRRIDYQRISNFLSDPAKGTQFMLRQGLLQYLNPQPNQRIWSPGNLLSQILGSGLVNIKRSGLLPIPGGIDTFFSPGYLQYFKHYGMNPLMSKQNVKGVEPAYKWGREGNKGGYGIGPPGAQYGGWANLKRKILRKKNHYNVSLADSYDKIDIINRLDIIKGVDNALPEKIAPLAKDMVNFRFEIMNTDDIESPDFIIFRAFLETMDDNFDASHNEYKYNGRGEKFYIYEGFERKISVSFKIAAQSRHEMKPLYRKLNYLAAQTAPNYSPGQGRIRTPFAKLTVGDYFKRVPGVITSVGISWSKEYPWEIKNHPDWDSDMKVLPHILDVTVSFQPIHNFTPQNLYSTPFIGIDGEDDDNWLAKGIATNKGEAYKRDGNEENIFQRILKREKDVLDKDNQEGTGDDDEKDAKKFTLWSKDKRSNFKDKIGDGLDSVGDFFGDAAGNVQDWWRKRRSQKTGIYNAGNQNLNSFTEGL